MSDTTAKINSKGCEGTGITEDLAAELYHQVGQHFMAIVELQVIDKHGPNLKDKRGVSLGLTQVWPAQDPNLEDHLRELTRVLHQNTAVTGADGTRQQILLEEGRDGIEPTVDGVIAANPGLKFHPYVSSQLAIDDSENGPVCDVCGKTEADRIHQAPPSTNPFEVLDEEHTEEDREEDPEEDDLHDFVEDTDGTGCKDCGMSAGAPIHIAPGEDG